ncbi:Peptidoglycan/LPS O-acetylase OafA/YrhL, contains acyltransferase and SGNH-hydrolase domains [Allochromatium warmingii]|uniref:Peptidoglycan/LPS O-acetylase OafA/YrhL, contains acyltransferase and SGNH-hydrolase domains n=1 Tax=Allochromatium warmingii TaxID=61595 RepID=A0A1H3BWV0_ALLWA|nr:acyltransferase [Allochromatium warmingii]SDX46336.1 Peptidoglycan/LPS O-acetylase OafA/YrhL, contains acyltransferase and SGNH-hydrolase domains [Allochromatium warmingii]
MAKLLSHYVTSRDNNFNLIRFLAATLVLYSHSFALAKTMYPEPLAHLVNITLGNVAVDIFFVTSGFLIAKSFFERQNLLAFIWARILRIYPALIVAVLFCTLIVGAIFTSYNLIAYFSDSQTYEYIAKNSSLISGVVFVLPGVFVDNHYKDAVNGSLWTLPYEIKMYALLVLMGLIFFQIQRFFKKSLLKPLFLFATLSAIFWNLFNYFQNDISFSIRFFASFFSGVSFYLYRDQIILSFRLFLALSIIVFLSAVHVKIFFFVYSFCLPYLLLYLAYVPSGPIRSFNKIGDYSYGIYIYAFPVQQSIAAMIPHVTVSGMVILSFVITFALAFLSWHKIEKKCLKMKGLPVLFEEKALHLRSIIATIFTKN